MKLTLSFYRRDDVVELSRDFIGKVIYTRKEGIITAGIITETEAYNGISDKASHAFGGRRTSRTEIMYASGGLAYVYLCYGIHSLFNIVSGKKDVPQAILVRAIYPVIGEDTMRLRRRRPRSTSSELCIGPGTVTQALGIHYSDTGLDLRGNEVWIEDKRIKINPSMIQSGPRVGVDYAGKDALLPYRFRVLHHQLPGIIGKSVFGKSIISS